VCSQPERALELFEEMTRRGLTPDAYTISSVMSATADLKNRTRAAEVVQVRQGEGEGRVCVPDHST
jgi:hypothetical protein